MTAALTIGLDRVEAELVAEGLTALLKVAGDDVPADFIGRIAAVEGLRDSLLRLMGVAVPA